MLSRRNPHQSIAFVISLILFAVVLGWINTAPLHAEGQVWRCAQLNRGNIVKMDPGPLVDDLWCRVIQVPEVHPYSEQTGPFYLMPNDEKEEPLYFAPNIEEYDIFPFIQNLNVQFVMDIYSESGVRVFDEGVPVCVRGGGTLLFLKTMRMPRQMIETPMYRVPEQPGFICTTIWEPGILVMIDEPTPLQLNSCQVVIRYALNLRAQPTDETNNVLTIMPVATRLEATGYLPGWFQVTYEDMLGWVTTDRQYVNFDGDCAKLLCSQDNRGLLITCKR